MNIGKQEDLLEIDFSNFGGPVYSGRAKGEMVRTDLNLDSYDGVTGRIRVIIPKSTYSVTSSFFLGLFGKSVRKAGSFDEFAKKFQFDTPEIFRQTIRTCVDRALREQTKLVG